MSAATFRDPSGDAPASADVAAVSVSSDDRGIVTFKVTYARRLPKRATTVVYLDSDRDASTGAPKRVGADYAVVLDGGTAYSIRFTIRRWNGRHFETTDGAAEDFSLAGRILTFSLNTSDLGKTRGARFVVTEGMSGRIVDLAPDAGRTPWTFHVAKKIELATAGFTIRPSAPAAGRTLVAALRVTFAAPIDLLTRLDVPSCKARVAGRSLAPLRTSLLNVRGSAEVTARCTWRVPPDSSGESLKASVAVEFEGKKLTRAISARIR
jgi:hypothetical protein